MLKQHLFYEEFFYTPTLNIKRKEYDLIVFNTPSILY